MTRLANADRFQRLAARVFVAVAMLAWLITAGTFAIRVISA